MASGGGYVDIPKFVDGYPPPTPPTWKKKDRYDKKKMKAVDARAKQVKLGNKTLEQLAGKLTDDYETDLEKVRAIFIWLGSQDKDSITPMSDLHDYLQGLFGFNIGFEWTEILTQLCRAANLPCVVISGNGKGAGYEVGQQDVSDMRTSWNCVFVDGSWQIIHPHWAFRGVSNHNTGRWTKIETEGKPTREKGEESEGTKIRHIGENYFCPDPEEFIYQCIADKKEWQLLKEPMDVHTFCNVPEFRCAYFSSDFKLTSAHDAIVKSVDGKCQIELEEKKETRYRLGYELFFDEKNSKEELPADELPRYIFYETNGSKLRILVRFRLIGIYKLSIKAGFYLFDIRLDATEKSTNENFLPVNPPIGFGYGQAVEQFGIIEPSHRPGVVVMQHNQVEDFRFKMVPVTNILAKMCHVGKHSASLSRYIKMVVKDNDVSIKVTKPDKEEYALQVYRETEREENNVLNYLLTSSKKDFEPLKKVNVSKFRHGFRPPIPPKPKKKNRYEEEKKTKAVDAKAKEVNVSKFRHGFRPPIPPKPKKKDRYEEEKKTKAVDAKAKEVNVPKSRDGFRPPIPPKPKKEDRYEEEKKTKAVGAKAKEGTVRFQKWRRRNGENTNKARAQYLMEDLRAARLAAVVIMEDAIRTYINEQLPDHRELREAVRDLVELYEKAVSRSWDDLGRLEDLLTRARKSTVASELKTSKVLIKAAAHLRLGRRKLLIMKLDMAFVYEIQTCKNPTAITMDILKCTCILLGEDPRNLRNWIDIQEQLKHRDIIQQMKCLETDALLTFKVESARELMERYKLGDANDVSAEIASIFQWNMQIIADATC